MVAFEVVPTESYRVARAGLNLANG